MQHYVEALCDENAELTIQLEDITRSGYSSEGREVVRKVGRVVRFIAVVAAAFVVGRLSN